MKQKTLYRGDRISNTTMPQRYRSCGIISKLLNGGNPAYIQRNGLIKSIQAHINPLTKAEKIFLSKSEFISFTENEDVAKKYCSYDEVQNKYLYDKLIQCEEYFETRYIFSLNISDCVPLDIKEGIYLLEYNCSQEKRKSDGLNESAIEFMVNIKWNKCEVCERNEKHKMYLIDSLRFLEFHKEFSLNKGAIKNAKKDNEWLVLPRDFYKQLKGYSSMIPVSTIWQAEHYILEGENKRDPYQFGMPGIMIDVI